MEIKISISIQIIIKMATTTIQNIVRLCCWTRLRCRLQFNTEHWILLSCKESSNPLLILSLFVVVLFILSLLFVVVFVPSCRQSVRFLFVRLNFGFVFTLPLCLFLEYRPNISNPFLLLLRGAILFHFVRLLLMLLFLLLYWCQYHYWLDCYCSFDSVSTFKRMIHSHQQVEQRHPVSWSYW